MSPARRSPTKNLSDPRGQLGAYLRAWLDKQPDRAAAKARLAKAAGVSLRAVGKWEEGEVGPTLQLLAPLSAAMGFANWGALCAAAARHHARA